MPNPCPSLIFYTKSLVRFSALYLVAQTPLHIVHIYFYQQGIGKYVYADADYSALLEQVYIIREKHMQFALC